MKIFIYEDDPSSSLDISLVIEYITSFGFSVDYRGNFFEYVSASLSQMHSFLESIKVLDVESPLEFGKDSIINSKNTYSFRGDLYDGLWLQRRFYNLLWNKKENELKDNFLHIIFTGKLFGTFEIKRYHARVLLTGLPSIISTSGMVEAPARPREYYFTKASFIQTGKNFADLDQIYKGRFLEYDDPKIAKITCSYALQVIRCFLTGYPFCEDSKCSLFNSHWQEEVLKLQYYKKVCNDCTKVLKA